MGDCSASTVPLPEDDPVLREAVQRLVHECQPERVILFGSRARGDAEPDSDYDLVVLVRPPAKEYELEAHMYGLLAGLPASFDVIVRTSTWWAKASRMPLTTEQVIEREGKVLHERRGTSGAGAGVAAEGRG